MTEALREAIPNQPRFRLRWLLGGRTQSDEWLSDPTWVPEGQRAVYRSVKEGLKVVLSGLDREGVVMLPSYVPGGLVATFLASGFDVRYYPVEPDLSLDADAFEEYLAAVSPSIVVFIHYLGFADANYPTLRAAAKAEDALVLEDCARGLFSHGESGELLGSTGDISVFSLYKTLPAPNGGLIVSDTCPLPEPTARRSEWRDLVGTTVGSLLEHFGIQRRQFTRTVVEDRQKYRETVQPTGVWSKPGWVSQRAFAHVTPSAVQSTRFDRYSALRERLVEGGLDVVTPPAPPGSSPYGVAVLLPSEAERNRLVSTLHRRHLPNEILTWPPVHRTEALQQFAGGMTLRRRLVIFPPHQQVPRVAISRVAETVLAHVG